jgi:hypothetical protein
LVKRARHWHVTLTLAGAPVEPLLVRRALTRLSEERPFLDSVTSTSTSAELRYWDEGESMLDVASLALRLWNEHRASANLPDWEVVGLEVIEKKLRQSRQTIPSARLSQE